MEVMKATAKDLDSAYKLMCELENKELSFEMFREGYLSNLNNAGREYFIAFISGDAIGFLSLAVDYRLFCADKVAVIDELVVAEQYRSKGVGKALLDVATEYAKNMQCAYMAVTSSVKRVGAHKFYEKNGFENNGYRFGKFLQ